MKRRTYEIHARFERGDFEPLSIEVCGVRASIALKSKASAIALFDLLNNEQVLGLDAELVIVRR